MASKRWLVRAGIAFGALALAASCATGSQPTDDDSSSNSGAGAGTPNGPLPGYAYRQGITVQDGTPAEVAVPFVIDHAALVAGDKALPEGTDVRVTYEAGGEVTQLDRVLDPMSSWNDSATRLWIRTTAVVDGSGSYYIYYGNTAAGAPPEDGKAVYDMWDDFEDGSVGPGWTFSGLSGATGQITEQDGALRVTATAQDFGGVADQIGVALFPYNGDFRVEVELSRAGGSLGGGSKAGGLTLRQSNADGARHMTVAIQQIPDARVRLFRTSDDQTTDNFPINTTDPYPHFLRMDRSGDAVSAFYSDANGAWQPLGVTETFATPLTDPVQVGIPLANNSGDDGWAELEWIRINQIITPAPTASLDGNEENFLP